MDCDQDELNKEYKTCEAFFICLGRYSHSSNIKKKTTKYKMK